MIAWKDTTALAPAVTTGMTEQEARAASRADRPMVVYVYPVGEDLDEPDPRFAVVDDDAFFDEKVLVGARYFDFYRIAWEDAREDAVLRDHVRRKAPTLVFLSVDYEEQATVRGRFSERRIYSCMARTLKRDFENDLGAALRECGDLARERSRIADDVQRLAELEEEIDATSGDARRARLIAERDELATRLDEVEADLRRRERELFQLQPKASA